MVKLFDFEPPPPLAAQVAKLLTAAQKNAPGNVRYRTRKAVRRRPYKPKPHRQNPYLYRVCEQIARAHAESALVPFEKSLTEWLYARAKIGEFPPPYWIPVSPAAPDYRQSTATSAPRLTAPAYAYRDPTNRPTLPTYAQALPSTDPAEYLGATVNEEFKDQLYSWRRWLFELPDNAQTRADCPCVIAFAMHITANASNRPARPFFSTIARAILTADATPPTIHNDPLHKRATTFYSRYRPRITAPPFYLDSYRADILMIPRLNTTADTLGAGRYIWLETGPKPLMGLHFNNNTTVHIQHAIARNPILYLANVRNRNGSEQPGIIPIDKNRLVFATAMRPTVAGYGYPINFGQAQSNMQGNSAISAAYNLGAPSPQMLMDCFNITTNPPWAPPSVDYRVTEPLQIQSITNRTVTLKFGFRIWSYAANDWATPTTYWRNDAASATY